MFTTRVRIHIVEWRDPAFRRALEACWWSVLGSSGPLDRAEAAHRLEAGLRRQGYERAIVEYGRSTDGGVAVADWTIHRDGQAATHA